MTAKPSRPEIRYGMRENADDGFWTVFDVFTGQPALINDTEMNMLEMEEADDLVDLLNRLYIERRGGSTQ